MDEGLLNHIIELTESNQNCPRLLNRDLRPVLRYACVSWLNAKASNDFMSGISYAFDTYREFTTPVYAVFNRNDRGLPRQPGDIQEIIDFIPSQNRTLRGYLRDRSDSLQRIGIESMNESDKGMNLAVFNPGFYYRMIIKWKYSETPINLESFHSPIYFMTNSCIR
jgi:hypothetical protein